jgi:hypothetical protein
VEPQEDHIFLASLLPKIQLLIIVNDDQQDATILPYLFIPDHLYMFRAMSSDHHEEHLTVFTASDIVHQYCCRLVSRMRWNPSHP